MFTALLAVAVPGSFDNCCTSSVSKERRIQAVKYFQCEFVSPQFIRLHLINTTTKIYSKWNTDFIWDILVEVCFGVEFELEVTLVVSDSLFLSRDLCLFIFFVKFAISSLVFFNSNPLTPPPSARGSIIGDAPYTGATEVLISAWIPTLPHYRPYSG